MCGPAPLGSDPPTTAFGEDRLNGFPGALAGVRRRRFGGRRHRVSDKSATGLSDAAKAGEPAYPPWPHSVCLPEGPGGGLCPL